MTALMLISAIYIPASAVAVETPIAEYTASASESLTQYVDMRFGTDNDSLCTIGPNRPNASVAPGPDTYPRSYSTGYKASAPIRGFSQIHVQAGEPNYSNFLLSPQIGLSTALDSHDSPKANENPTASEYSVTLSKYDIDVALTPAEHSVFYKFTYPESSEASLIIDMAYDNTLNHSNPQDINITAGTDEQGNTIVYGYARYDIGYEYFYAVANKAAKKIGTYTGSETSDAISVTGYNSDDTTAETGVGAYLQFDTSADEKILFKIGVSFKSVDKAREWLESEIPAWDYDALKAETNEIWENVLSKVQISGNLTEYQKKMFYTCLYGCYKMPRDRTGDIEKFGEADMIDDHIATWDTFRTLYPLYTITNPEFVAKTVNSYITRLDTNGWVRDLVKVGKERPRNQGGDDIDNIISEAYVKGIEGVDWEEAYRVLKDNADCQRDDQNTWNVLDGKTSGVDSTYRTLGYIPADLSSTWVMCCAKQLEYAYNDYCAAQVAKGLGKTEDYEKYLARSASWQNLWNENLEYGKFTGFIWPRNSDGTWLVPNEKLSSAVTFNYSWNNYFYEGTAYEYSFFAPHDIDTLIEKMGGEKAFISRLQTGIDSGYINVGNQPGFIQAFLFNHTSEPWHTSDTVEKILNKFSLSGTPGCDDSGSMCAWYLFSTIGFFPNAGQSFYYLTSPKYETTTFTLDNGKTFTVRANNLSNTNKYIQSVTLNGKAYNKTTIEHSDIIGGGELVFNMGSTPVNYTITEIGSGECASGNYEWTLRGDGTLSILGTGNGTLSFDSVITESSVSDIPWNKYADQITKVIIAENTGITSVSDYVLSNLPNVIEIVVPTTLTDLSAGGIFANNTSLKTITVQGTAGTDGVMNLENITAFGDDIFRGASDGLAIKLILKNTVFAPKQWFTDATTVNFRVPAKDSPAEEWIANVQNGTDTRDNGYKFAIGNVEYEVLITVEDTNYSWTLNTETGTLTFYNTKQGWNELNFSNGCKFIKWIVDWKNDVKHIVIPTFSKLSITSDSPFASLKNLETVKIDTIRWTAQWKSVFSGCASLTTLGTSDNFEIGKVKLDKIRFENIYSNTLYMNMFKDCTSITDIDFTGNVMYSDGGNTKIPTFVSNKFLSGCSLLKNINLSGITAIKSESFANCTSLETVTIPNTVTAIAEKAFTGCTALKAVNLETETFADGFITATSFPDTEGLIIYCVNNEVANAFNALGYKHTRAVNVNVKAKGGIKMEGFSIRYSGYNGLRGIFSFDHSVVAENENNGFTLVEFGAMAASESVKNSVGTDLSYVNGEFVTPNNSVVKKAVWKNGNFVDKILADSTEDKTNFAVAIVNYKNNYDTNVCMLGYSIWKDTFGNYSYVYVDCDNDDYDVTSIYKVTLGMYKDGFVGADDDTDGVIWEVLENCAVTLTSGTDYRSGDYDLDGNTIPSEMNMKNIPIYKSNKGSISTGGTYTYGNNQAGTLIGVTYSKNGDQTFTILPDGDDYVLVIRGTGDLPKTNLYGIPATVSQFNKSFNTYYPSWHKYYLGAYLYNADGEIVGYIDDKNRYMEIGYDYDTNPEKVITDTSTVQRRQPTPTFTSSTIDKIKTVIIDNGITNISGDYLIEMKIEKIIYSNTVKSLGERALWKTSTLSSMTPKGKTPVDGLIDLSGFTFFGNCAFQKVPFANKNVVLPKGIKVAQELFSDGEINAVSTDRRTLIDGFADLRGITSIGNKAFAKAKISRLYFDDSIGNIPAEAFSTSLGMTIYTNAENVSNASAFASSGSRSYLGGTSFEVASGLASNPAQN